MLIIYHNAKCSKSRETTCLLENSSQKFKIIEYLKNPLSKEELKDLIHKLGIRPEDLVRKKEPIFLEKYKAKKLTNAQWIAAMVKYPILMERPIIVDGKKAIICRPPEKLYELIG